MTPLIGNEAARDAMRRAMSGSSLHHAWLIAGPEGVGKARFAHQVALRMLAEADDPTGLPPGFDVPDSHRTAHYHAAGAHPDFRELKRLPKDADKPEQGLARSIKVDQIRHLINSFSTKPAMSSRRVVIIDAIDDVEAPGGANALLKVLEEPPDGTVFLLVSHAPGRLLPTVRSRCRLLRFDPLRDDQVATVLRSELPDADPGEIDALVRAGEGSPGRALHFAGLELAKLEADMVTLAKTGDPGNAVRTRLSKQLGAKAAQARYEAFLERAPNFIAGMARERSGEALRQALDSYAEARNLGGMALGVSLDAGATAFEMAGLIARLAPAR